MERRIKLTMAAMSFALLVAGGVRRWARERDIDWLTLAPRGQAVDLGTAGEEESFAKTEASATTALPQPSAAVWPAAANVPDAAILPPNGPWQDPHVMPAGYARQPQPATTLPPQNNDPPLPDTAPATSPRPAREQVPLPADPQPAYAPNPAPAQPRLYVVQPNDSFWTISQRIYGTGRYFHALYEYNRRLCPQPDRLPPGVTIETPEPQLLERSFPELFR
jgi:nucleoid-associated protein YgaU